ncbi:polyketide cyclase [Jatrophihabitans sp. DSM 45814]
MWSTEYSTDTAVSPQQIWSALRALHTGTALSEASDRFEIHGPFAVGTEISVTPQGQDTFQSRITELVENEVYADQTSFGDVTLLFRHTLRDLGNGGTRITHQLEIDGAGADQAGPELGAQISADFPAAMQDLIAAAQASLPAP